MAPGCLRGELLAKTVDLGVYASTGAREENEVEFSTTNLIAASADEVLRAMADSGYYEFLSTKVSAIEQPELLSETTNHGVLEVRVRYAFAGEVGGPARMFIDSDKLTWVIHSSWDLATKAATVDIIPDHYTDLVVADAEMTLVDGDQGCTETMAGSLQVKVPLIGAQAEKIIIEGLVKHLAAEAVALGAYAATLR